MIAEKMDVDPDMCAKKQMENIDVQRKNLEAHRAIVKDIK